MPGFMRQKAGLPPKGSKIPAGPKGARAEAAKRSRDAKQEEEDQEEEIQTSRWNDAYTSWLTSGAFHTVMMVVLGLWTLEYGMGEDHLKGIVATESEEEEKEPEMPEQKITTQEASSEAATSDPTINTEVQVQTLELPMALADVDDREDPSDDPSLGELYVMLPTNPTPSKAALPAGTPGVKHGKKKARGLPKSIGKRGRGMFAGLGKLKGGFYNPLVRGGGGSGPGLGTGGGGSGPGLGTGGGGTGGGLPGGGGSSGGGGLPPANCVDSPSMTNYNVDGIDFSGQMRQVGSGYMYDARQGGGARGGQYIRVTLVTERTQHYRHWLKLNGKPLGGEIGPGNRVLIPGVPRGTSVPGLTVHMQEVGGADADGEESKYAAAIRGYGGYLPFQSGYAANDGIGTRVRCISQNADHFVLLFEETHASGVDWNDLVFLVEKVSGYCQGMGRPAQQPSSSMADNPQQGPQPGMGRPPMGRPPMGRPPVAAPRGRDPRMRGRPAPAAPAGGGTQQPAGGRDARGRRR